MTPADPPDLARHPVAANDNGDADGPDSEALRKVNDVVLHHRPSHGARGLRQADRRQRQRVEIHR